MLVLIALDISVFFCWFAFVGFLGVWPERVMGEGAKGIGVERE